MTESKSCKNCKNAIFEPVWGEYKCGKDGVRVRNMIYAASHCKSYEKGEPSISKREWEEK